MTLDEWISRFDNEEAGELTQEEQLEIKSMLIELRWRRDEMNDFTETMKDRAEAWLEAYNKQEDRPIATKAGLQKIRELLGE